MTAPRSNGVAGRAHDEGLEAAVGWNRRSPKSDRAMVGSPRADAVKQPGTDTGGRDDHRAISERAGRNKTELRGPRRCVRTLSPWLGGDAFSTTRPAQLEANPRWVALSRGDPAGAGGRLRKRAGES